MAINKIMVLGAGTMGMGIAQVFAEAGKTVLVRDIADAFIQRGEGVLKKNLEKKVAKGKITEEQKNDMLSRVSFTLELADAKDCDLVVEAAIEVLDIKKGIFKELDEICKPETILASNTSSISITAIAAATKRPEKVLGMHFFNPAPVMKLVEVIAGENTPDETVAKIVEISDFPTDNGSNWGGDSNSNVSYYPFKVFVTEDANLQAGDYVDMSYQKTVDTSGSSLYLQTMFIRSENGKSYVLARGEDGKLEQRWVQTGRDLWGSYTQIRGGLTVDDYVAFPYGRDVKPGAATVEATADQLYGGM